MKPTILLLTTSVLIAGETLDSDRSADPIILDETAVANLRIETVEAGESDFEESIFALGRIEAIPSRHGVVASRVPGRIIELGVSEGDSVATGTDVAGLESRQPDAQTVVLKAPLGGLVTEVKARLGEPVEPDKVLIEITDLSEVHAVARVPEHHAGGLKPGAKAHIRVAALPGQEFEGELLRFGIAANRQTGTIDAIFRLPNPGLALRPGMRTEFSIVLSSRTGVLSIPREGVQGDPGSRYVFVRDFELKNAFVKSPVQLGAQNDRRIEILGGLLPGDEVVTSGAYALAFAGKGSVSLKEALDAAHGHPHNEDGSEMTEAQRAAAQVGAPGDSRKGDHAASSGWVIFLAGTSALLLVLLVLSLLHRRLPTTV